MCTFSTQWILSLFKYERLYHSLVFFKNVCHYVVINMWLKRKKEIYLDHAAATKLAPEVFKAMLPFLREDYGNPSSVHSKGRQAREAVEQARVRTARVLGVRPDDVFFTGSGTESNNLAIMGLIQPYIDAGKAGEVSVISSPAEHPSVSEVFKYLKERGVEVLLAELDKDGLITKESFKALLNNKTKLVSIVYAASETGVVQNIRDLSRLVKAFNKENQTNIVFHTDASQAPLWLDCGLENIGVDMLTLDAGKCCGPKGVGVLVKRPRASLAAVTHGGSQENSLRPATENVAGIIGMATALERAVWGREKCVEKVKNLRDYAIEKLLEIEGVYLNGSSEKRLANNINISIPGIDSEYTTIVLDKAGIACSTRSACSGKDGSGSAVVLAMTNEKSRANSTLRFTLGKENTKKDIDFLVKTLAKHIQETKLFQTTLKSNN